MSDGNDSNIPEMNNVSAQHIMDSLVPGAFGVTITTTDVVGGMPGVAQMVPLTSNEGYIEAEHHQIGLLTEQTPTQDFAGLRDKGAN